MDKSILNKQITNAVINCKKCRLCKTRTKAVPGDGSINSPIVFIGEAPGQNEDRVGLPFVGRAGALLENLLGKIRMTRKDVWIGNVIKCRPPENRDPMVDELRNCSPYLEEQIKMIDPKVIITLGRFAMEHFYKEGKISRDHGVAKIWKGKILFPLYHPAAALRSPQVLNDLTRDFLKIPEVLRKGKVGLDSVGSQEKSKGNLDDNQMKFM